MVVIARDTFASFSVNSVPWQSQKGDCFTNVRNDIAEKRRKNGKENKEK